MIMIIIGGEQKWQNVESMCTFGMINFANLFYYLAYFLYYSWVSLYYFS